MTVSAHATYSSGLIALDWGTSSLRAYRFDADGKRVDQRALPWGIMQLPPLGANAPADDGFRTALRAACIDWIDDFPGTPLIAAGMIGSKQGWREVPYLTTPLDIDDIGRTLTVVDTTGGALPALPPLHIVPGLLQESVLPNVMRGEETQVAGVLDQLQVNDLLVGLPGTHSKWVRVRGRRIVHFDTFMTGEVYAALCRHTILGRTMDRDGAIDEEAFLRGAVVAKTPDGRSGVLSNIFSTRTLGLTGALSPRAQADYLSGLLIGHEIAALLATDTDVLQQRIALIGDAALCVRYRHVLGLYGLKEVDIATAATERGLWKLALHAGLITRCSS